MSRRKDRERVETTGMIMRGGKLISKEQVVTVKKQKILFLTCNKCKHAIPSYMIDDHIEKCQGGKAECGKCHRYIQAKGFMEHFTNCPGEVKNGGL